MNINIGTIIKNLRTKKQITQKQLATYLGVTEQAVSRWESGGGFPDIQLLPSIASFFGVSTDTLLGINVTEREKRLAEIRRKIDEASEICSDNTEETIAEARAWAYYCREKMDQSRYDPIREEPRFKALCKKLEENMR